MMPIDPPALIQSYSTSPENHYNTHSNVSCGISGQFYLLRVSQKLCHVCIFKQAEKLKSCEMKDEGWKMKVERWRKNVERWRFKVEGGFEDGQTNKWTDIYDCRVAFVTENNKLVKW